TSSNPSANDQPAQASLLVLVISPVCLSLARLSRETAQPPCSVRLSLARLSRAPEYICKQRVTEK
ncbi:MAG: hypothetical protein ACKPKO_29000, partial [Candidatus Fonsibacter sp.]